MSRTHLRDGVTRRRFVGLSGLLLAAATALPLTLAGAPASAQPLTLDAIKKAGVVRVGVGSRLSTPSPSATRARSSATTWISQRRSSLRSA